MHRWLASSTVWRWVLALIVLAMGAWWHFYSLTLIERYVSVFPTVHDILMEQLPRVDFGIWGEILFFGLILVFAGPHFRYRWRTTPWVLMTLGLMYFFRGWFLFLFPIGAPQGAVGPDQRLALWGHETHAFFPGGHIAILTILAMFSSSRRVRLILWCGLVVFGVGTMLAKTHYTMDSVGGVLLGYTISVWVQGRVKQYGRG